MLTKVMKILLGEEDGGNQSVSLMPSSFLSDSDSGHLTPHYMKLPITWNEFNLVQMFNVLQCWMISL